MNTAQAIVQIIANLQALTYGGGEPVFSDESVFASAAPEEEVYTSFRMPLAIIGVGAMRCDPEDPRLCDQTLTLRLAVTSLGDSRGTTALMGGHRVGATTDSRGRGLLELETDIMGALGIANAADSLPIELRSAGGARPRLMDDGRYLLMRDYEFTAHLTTIPS